MYYCCHGYHGWCVNKHRTATVYIFDVLDLYLTDHGKIQRIYYNNVLMSSFHLLSFCICLPGKTDWLMSVPNLFSRTVGIWWHRYVQGGNDNKKSDRKQELCLIWKHIHINGNIAKDRARSIITGHLNHLNDLRSI